MQEKKLVLNSASQTGKMDQVPVTFDVSAQNFFS